MAADTGSAILRSTGGVWVNGMEGSRFQRCVSGRFAGDQNPASFANLDAEGSSILDPGRICRQVSRQFSGFGARKRIRGNFYIDGAFT